MIPSDVTLEKTLPNSIESERAVLGAIILDHKAIFPATEILTAEDFYLESHREIFRAMLALVQEGTAIDLFTVLEELRRRNKVEASGCPAYLAALTDGLPRAINLEHYARTVREKATSRRLIQLSNEVISRCFDGEERPAEILESAESEIFRIASREIQRGFQPASNQASRALREIEEASKYNGQVAGLDTGFADLNRLTGGFHRRDLVVVSARPGLGKTSCCLNVVCHSELKCGKHVGIFSLEMSKPEIMKRMISREAEVDAHMIQSGYQPRIGGGWCSSGWPDLGPSLRVRETHPRH